MLISADLIPLKKLPQEHPTARVIDLRQQLQLTSFVHLVNCRLRTRGTLKSTCHCPRTSRTHWQQPQNPFLVPSIRPLLMKGLPWHLGSPKKKASFTLNRSCKLIHAPSLLCN